MAPQGEEVDEYAIVELPEYSPGEVPANPVDEEVAVHPVEGIPIELVNELERLKTQMELIVYPDSPEAVRARRESQAVDPDAPMHKDVAFPMYVATALTNPLFIFISFYIYSNVNDSCAKTNQLLCSLIAVVWTIVVLYHGKEAIGATCWTRQTSLGRTCFAHAMGMYLNRDWAPISPLTAFVHLIALACIEQGFRMGKRVSFLLYAETFLFYAFTSVGTAVAWSHGVWSRGKGGADDVMDAYFIVWPFIGLCLRFILLTVANNIEDYNRYTQQVRMALSGISFFMNVWLVCALCMRKDSDALGVCK